MPAEPKKILLVDDEKFLVETLSYAFIAEGYEVFHAYNGKEGLTMAKKIKPDIILLDRVMPEMGGMAMLQKLRKSGDWGNNVPVIFLTNIIPIDDDDKENIVLKHPAVYMVKTQWKIKDLVAKVKEILEDR